MVISFRKRNAWLALLLSVTFVLQLTLANAQTQNQAGLVIQHGDGSVSTHCIRFDEPTINGMQLLTRAGVTFATQFGGLGAAVCSIDGEGCAYPTESCFCQCQGASCAYWNYFHLLDNAWRYSPLGADGYTIENGAVDAWLWGDQDAPPIHTLEQICSVAPVAPSSTPTVMAEATTPPTTTADSVEATQTQHPTSTSEPGIEPTAIQIAQSSDTPEPTASLAPPLPTVSTQSTLPASDVQDEAPDTGSYIIVGIVIVVLGGWLVISRMRR